MLGSGLRYPTQGIIPQAAEGSFRPCCLPLVYVTPDSVLPDAQKHFQSLSVFNLSCFHS